MKPRVLIVDDEPALRRTLERAVGGFGCEVMSAGDAEVAYELLHGNDVDLVLLDLNLSEMSGDTLFLALTRRWPRLLGRIVLMTGDTFAEKEHWPEALRRCPLLLKPFTLEALRATIQSALDATSSGGQRAGNGPA